MRPKLLLLEDVEDLGKSGEIVTVKPGYARNFLIPKKKGVVARKHALRMQKRLQEERSKRAVEEKSESEAISNRLKEIKLEVLVKVDPEGKMYGSVSRQDIISLLEKENVKLEKKTIDLKHPIKETGVFDIKLKLKEGVLATCSLNIIPEGGEKKQLESEKLENKTVEEENKIVEEKVEEESKDSTDEK